MIPFAILYFTGFLHPAFHGQHAHSETTSLSMALFTIMWNCLGWDNATTYAGEVNRPVRSYLKAIMLAFSAVYLFYISFTWLAIHSGIDHTLFAEKGVPYLGIQIGGQSLGSLLSFGGMASMLGIFCAVMLSVSRVPAVMGKDKLLPPAFTRVHKKYNTPYISIIICSGIVSLLVLRPLADLLIMDICLYAAGISLEFISLIRLRKSAAADERPFRIPFQKSGLLLLFSAPVLVFSIALGTALAGPRENLEASIVAILAILSAPLAWMLIGKNKRGAGV
jgi:amino acid transporter